MNCRICGNLTDELFRKEVLHKYEAEYRRCRNCGFIQLENPFFLDEAYARSITASDVGLLARNLRFAEQLAPAFYWFFERDKRYLDYGGGYGVFVRLMRDIGFDFRWSDRYTANLFADGFAAGNEEEGFEAITALEVFEHLDFPMTELERLLERSDTVAIGTNLTDGCPENELANWHYLGCEHGQHISFFSVCTFRHIAARLKLHLYTDGRGLTILTRRKPSSRLATVIALRHRYSVLLLEFVKLRMCSRIEADAARARGERQ
ncbi:MAG: methyltransferase domain-containing protein [Victivallaceae bacterium]